MISVFLGAGFGRPATGRQWTGEGILCVGCVCGGFSMLSDRRVRGGRDAPS